MTVELALAFRRALKRGLPVALMVYIDHPDGAVRVWSGIGPLSHDGHTWQGIGSLGRISGLNQTAALAVRQISFELRGVPPEALAYLGTNLRNRTAQAWIAAFGRDGKMQGVPFPIVNAKLDYEELDVGADGKATIKLNANVGFFSIERPLDLVWSNEQQQQDYPGDTGLSLIPDLVDKEVRWRLTD